MRVKGLEVILLFFFVVSIFAEEISVNDIISKASRIYDGIGCVEGRIRRKIEFDKLELELLGNFSFCDINLFEINYLVPYEKNIAVRNDSIFIESPTEGIMVQQSFSKLSSKGIEISGIMDFPWAFIRYLAEKFSFGFIYKGKIEKIDSILVAEGRPKLVENLSVGRVLIWLDMAGLELLRVEGYNEKDELEFILTIDRFEMVSSYKVPVEYTLYLPVEDKQGKIITSLNTLRLKTFEKSERRLR